MYGPQLPEGGNSTSCCLVFVFFVVAVVLMLCLLFFGWLLEISQPGKLWGLLGPFLGLLT